MPTARGWLVAALGLGLVVAGVAFGATPLQQLGLALGAEVEAGLQPFRRAQLLPIEQRAQGRLELVGERVQRAGREGRVGGEHVRGLGLGDLLRQLRSPHACGEHEMIGVERASIGCSHAAEAAAGNVDVRHFRVGVNRNTHVLNAIGQARDELGGAARAAVGVVGRADDLLAERRFAPPQVNVDLRLSKRVRLGGRSTVEGIFEVFNLFNRANFYEDTNQSSFAIYGTGAFGSNPLATYGKYTTALPPRQVQLAAKISF